MPRPVSRRRFLTAPAAAVALSGLAVGALGQEPPKSASKAAGKVPDRRPPLDRELVRQFVGAAHGNLDKVKEMLSQQPKFVNATWDWGGGDWETALGGAAHMGRADIARFLLEKGARLDVFAAAMLGQLDVVKAAVAAFPNIVAVPGPHGITLLAHAKAGKADAAAVVTYLESLPKA